MSRNLCRPAFTAVTLCLLLGASASPAAACAFDGGAAAGLFDGSFEARYPKSSTVYFAIVDAVEQGILEKSAFQPVTPGPAGYWKAVGRLDSMARRLSAVAARSHPEQAISVVFIESNLWARFEPGAQGYGMTAHIAGARQGDVVLVTSEGGIAAVLDGRLPVEAALERGLIAIDAEPAAGEAIKALMLVALGGPEPAAAASARNAPARLFGPAR
jgi:hypothetical protein